MTLRRVLLLAVLACAAAPTGADGAVYFSSDRCAGGASTRPAGPAPPGDTRGCASAIWRAADDGTGLRRITDGSTGTVGESSVATDLLGMRLFYVASTRASRGGGRIWSMGPDGGGRRMLTPEGTSEGPLVIEGSPTVSPTGSLVAFESNRGDVDTGGGPHLWVMAADGSGLRQLTSGPGADRVPRFSPDGTRLVYFRSASPVGERTVVTRSLAGGPELEVISSDAQVGPFTLAFSPDGRQLAFTIFDGLHTLDLVTGEVTRRADQANEAGWSPFGPTLYYSAVVPATGKLGLFRLDVARPGARPVPVTDGGDGYDSGPAWAALGVELPELPKVDVLAPAVGLVGGLASPGGSTARTAQAGRASRLRYVAADPSGVRDVRVAVARESGKRCRPVDRRGRLGRARSCRATAGAPYRAVREGSLAKLARRLPRGRYRAWFRARDGEGNVTRRPLPQRFTRGPGHASARR